MLIFVKGELSGLAISEQHYKIVKKHYCTQECIQSLVQTIFTCIKNVFFFLNHLTTFFSSDLFVQLSLAALNSM